MVLLALAITEQNGNLCYNARNDGLVQVIYATKPLNRFTTIFLLSGKCSHETEEVVHRQH